MKVTLRLRPRKNYCLKRGMSTTEFSQESTLPGKGKEASPPSPAGQGSVIQGENKHKTAQWVPSGERQLTGPAPRLIPRSRTNKGGPWGGLLCKRKEGGDFPPCHRCLRGAAPLRREIRPLRPSSKEEEASQKEKQET